MPDNKINKMPPQNIEAEKSLLGCLMIDPEAITKVADLLHTDDFYQEKHTDIYEAIVNLFEKRNSVDVLSVSNRLREKGKLETVGGSSYLTSLVNCVPTATHVLDYAKIVREKKVLRDLISASFDISKLGYKEEEDIDLLLDKAEQKIFDIAKKSLTQRFVQVGETLEDTFKRIDNLSKGDGTLRGIPTGFKALDSKLAGLQKSDLIILAARPGIGKSAMATDIARYVACEKKIPVGIFSLEMSQDQIIDRLIAAQADIDLWKLRTGRLSDKGDDNDFQRIQNVMNTLSGAPIYIDDTALANVLQMRAMARRLKARQGLGLIIVDYLQLMEARDGSQSIVQQVTEHSKGLKVMAKELGVPVLALSQLSRAVEKRIPPIPRLSDLRESGCLAGDTLITRADTGERIPIKNLVGKKDIPVHSLDKDWQIKEKKISKVFCSGKKMVYELKLRSGSKIKASANHPFWSINGWTRLDGLKIGEQIAVADQTKLDSPRKILKEIVSIKSLGVEDVYDATVPGTHNFAANDIIVHNSLEQDADVVLFIYREDYYKENTERQNIADIIIGKHRNGPTGRVELYFDETRASFRNLQKEYKDVSAQEIDTEGVEF